MKVQKGKGERKKKAKKECMTRMNEHQYTWPWRKKLGPLNL
jgi:hypothetical protein